jgi:hypothetical protein
VSRGVSVRSMNPYVRMSAPCIFCDRTAAFA